MTRLNKMFTLDESGRAILSTFIYAYIQEREARSLLEVDQVEVNKIINNRRKNGGKSIVIQ